MWRVMEGWVAIGPEMGQEMLPDESLEDLAVHGFWKWGITAVFAMITALFDM